jgi:predicted small secreted protein
MNIPHERIDTYDNGVEENVPFSVLKDGTKRTLSYAGNYILYTPEYRNVETSGVEVEHTALTFTLKGQEYTVPFGEYDEAGKWNGTYLDIIRNYCYQFIITTSPNGPKVNYVVLPWEEETAGDIIFD